MRELVTTELDSIIKGKAIGGVSLGMTRESVFELKGVPEDWEGKPRELTQVSSVWRYGALQIEFVDSIVSVVTLFYDVASGDVSSGYNMDLLGEFTSQTWTTERIGSLLSELEISYTIGKGFNRQPEFTLDSGLKIGFAYLRNRGEKRPDLPSICLFRLGG
jgi:hypothetical protein